MFKELSKLFDSPARTKLLKFFVFQPDVRATAAAAGSAIGIPKAVAEREARTLVRLGLLVARKQKGKILLALNQDEPLVGPLRAFLDVATLPDNQQLLAAFRGVSGISLIVATGVLAQEERSAVDFLIVSKKPKNTKIAKAVAKIERLVGLPLRYLVLEPEVYAERLEARDRILRDVFEFKNRVILGRPS